MRTKNNLVAALFLTVTFAMNAQNMSCDGFGNFFVQSWEYAYNIAHPIGEQALTLIPVAGQDSDVTDAISDLSEDFHAFVFDENRQSWATVGAREIPVLKTITTQGGKLVRVGPVAGVRVFTTAPLLWDSVEIEIEKLKGGLETEIIICTFDLETGAKNNILPNYVFPNNKNLSSKKFTIRNTHGKSISVKLLGKETNFDVFKYSIKTQGFLNVNKQKNRVKKANIERLNTTGLGAGNKKKTRN
ncbi:hypothetical protein [Flagellimonas eckloniae]|uniref:Uncharacterized protein n=1 Tax=Flagellimonas eckloniae TaxID=346185 RepID=A0A0Q1BJM7_9FLAO|nr:hypothetical protein [Allomuricauda eckloniae]KQC30879.1 hypothetical protein AAY42_14015 [Allomuricauda eckloniae]